MGLLWIANDGEEVSGSLVGDEVVLELLTKLTKRLPLKEAGSDETHLERRWRSGQRSGRGVRRGGAKGPPSCLSVSVAA